MSDQPSGWAMGYSAFAAIMLILTGFYQIMVGLSAVIDDEFYGEPADYAFRLTATAWGWVHLILGVVVVIAGIGIFRGTMLGRVVGVIAAGANALTAFAWLPYYPGWAFVLIAFNVAVIWALAAHGHDLAEGTSSTF